jgi:hypothetical protein
MVDDTSAGVGPEPAVPATQPGEDAGDPRADLVAAATVFVDALSRNPGLVDTIDEVLEEYLGKPDTTAVARRLNFALNHVIGSPGGNYLIYYIGSNDPESIISALDDVDASEEDREFANRVMRRLQAIFGYGVSAVVQAMDENPDDWARATRKVYYDVLESRWVFELDLEKYNGEPVHLVMSPDASTRLGAGIILGINAVQDNVFDDEGVTMLIDEMVKFLARYGGTVSFAESGTSEPLTGSDRLGDTTTDPNA